MRHPAARLARPLSAALALAATAACAGFVRPVDGTVAGNPGGRDAELDARRLLAPTASAANVDPARVAAVATALRTARSRVPDARDVAVDPIDESFIVVLTPEASAAWRAHGGHGGESTGLAALDAVTRSLGGARAEVGALAGGASLSLRFARPVDAAAASAAYRAVDGVRYAGAAPGAQARPLSWTVMMPHGTQTNFVFARADQAGGAGADYMYVTYDSLTHSAFLVAREHHGGANDDAVSTWDVPGRGAAGVYASFDDVLSGLGDRRWWQRRHAVDVLDALLDTAPNAFVPNDARGAAHLAELKRDAAARRGEALDALASRADDADLDVATLAVGALRALTSQPIGGGAEGATQWHAWLAMNAPMAPSAPTLRSPRGAGRVATRAERR